MNNNIFSVVDSVWRRVTFSRGVLSQGLLQVLCTGKGLDALTKERAFLDLNPGIWSVADLFSIESQHAIDLAEVTFDTARKNAALGDASFAMPLDIYSTLYRLRELKLRPNLLFSSNAPSGSALAHTSALRSAANDKSPLHGLIDKYTVSVFAPRGWEPKGICCPMEFSIYLDAVNERLRAGDPANYLKFPEVQIEHPINDFTPTFVNACMFAAIFDVQYPTMLAQSARLLAAMIRHDAPVPRNDQDPFRALLPNQFKTLDRTVTAFYNLQMPSEAKIANLEDLQRTKHAATPKPK